VSMAESYKMMVTDRDWAFRLMAKKIGPKSSTQPPARR
jgi:hypothetical protein